MALFGWVRWGPFTTATASPKYAVIAKEHGRTYLWYVTCGVLDSAFAFQARHYGYDVPLHADVFDNNNATAALCNCPPALTNVVRDAFIIALQTTLWLGVHFTASQTTSCATILRLRLREPIPPTSSATSLMIVKKRIFIQIQLACN